MARKFLYLMRHGEAEPQARVMDFERALSLYGQKQIKAQAAQFKAPEGIRPDVVFCSTARRTRETAEGLQKLFRGVPFFYRETLYLAPTRRLVDLIKNVDEIFQRILIIGHNPGLEQFVSLLDEKGTQIPMGTADCVEMSLNIKTWDDIQPGVGKVEKMFLGRI